MKVLVCGDRNWANEYRIGDGYLTRHDLGWEDYILTIEILDEIKLLQGIDLVIHGCARGADQLGKHWAESRGVPVMEFPAEWDKYGKSAGPIRNRQMLWRGKPNMVLAFHRDFQHSKGTANMVEIARKAKVLTSVFPR